MHKTQPDPGNVINPVKIARHTMYIDLIPILEEIQLFRIDDIKVINERIAYYMQMGVSTMFDYEYDYKAQATVYSREMIWRNIKAIKEARDIEGELE